MLTFHQYSKIIGNISLPSFKWAYFTINFNFEKRLSLKWLTFPRDQWVKHFHSLLQEEITDRWSSGGAFCLSNYIPLCSNPCTVAVTMVTTHALTLWPLSTKGNWFWNCIWFYFLPFPYRFVNRKCCQRSNACHTHLTHWGQNKMDINMQKTFSFASWTSMMIITFWLNIQHVHHFF